MADLDPNQLKSLESLRQRLLVLRNSMQALQSDLVEQPMPSWSSLQKKTRGVLDSIQLLTVQTKDNDELCRSVVAFPTPLFPAPTKDMILQGLLRTRYDPVAQEWIEEGQAYASKSNSAGVLTESDRAELWRETNNIFEKQSNFQLWGADYTRTEIEDGVNNLVTGLRRELVVIDIENEAEEDEDEEDDAEGAGAEVEGSGDEDEDAMEMDSKPQAAFATSSMQLEQRQMPIAVVQKFMTTGVAG